MFYFIDRRRHHTFDVKTCFQQNRYVFDVIVTSWVLFVFCISWNFARDISTVFEEIKHLVVVHQTIFYQIIKINKTQLLLKYLFGARGVKFLEKRREDVQLRKQANELSSSHFRFRFESVYKYQPCSLRSQLGW